MRGYGVVTVVISIVLAVSGLWRLAATGRVPALVGWLAALVAWPILFALLFEVRDDHMRLWLAMPVAATGPLWLMSGFFISRSANPRPPPQTPKSRPSETRKRIGWLVLAAGLVAWYHGLTHPQMGRTEELLTAATFLYGCLLGTWWALTGRPFAE